MRIVTGNQWSSRVMPCGICAAAIFLLLITVTVTGCDQGRLPQKELDPEEKATQAFSELNEEFEAERKALGMALRRGEATEDDFIDLDLKFRVKLEEFVAEHRGTEAAAGVELGFIQQEMDEGQYGSVRGRIARLQKELPEGDDLALLLIYLSVLDSDHDLELGLEHVERAIEMPGVNEGTLIEAGVQRLKLLQWLGRDEEFESLYISLSGKVGPTFAAPLTLMRLHFFMRNGRMDAVEGLIDSVSGEVSEGTLTMLKAEVASYMLLGRKTLPMEGADFSGNYFDPEYFEGKTILLLFFTTSNPVMRRYVPILNRLQTEYEQSGLEVVGVSMDPVAEDVIPFMSEMEITWIVLKDPEMELQGSYLAARDPKAYVINSDGILVSQGLEGVLLEKTISRLLGPLE